MTKNELIQEYLNWAASHMVYATPRDIDDATSLLAFDAAASETSLSAISVFAITKHHREKIHMFVFTYKQSWLCNDIGDMIDDTFTEEWYDLFSAN